MMGFCEVDEYVEDGDDGDGFDDTDDGGDFESDPLCSAFYAHG